MLPTLATIIIARAGHAINEIGVRPTAPGVGGPPVGACAAMSPALSVWPWWCREPQLVVSMPSISDTRSS